MSRTDKTDPHRVKVERYGEHYWMPIHHCGCYACHGQGFAAERRKARTEARKAERNWRREYEDAP
jgi:hypothetical protein